MWFSETLKLDDIGQNSCFRGQIAAFEARHPKLSGCPQVPGVCEAPRKEDNHTARSKAVATPSWPEAQRCEGAWRGMFLL